MSDDAIASSSVPSTSGSTPAQIYTIKRKRKRSDSANSVVNSELLCPICFELLKDVHVTVCGHSFCFQCITRWMNQPRRSCPLCKSGLPLQNAITPNFALNTAVERHIQQQVASTEKEENAVVPTDSALRVVETRKQRVHSNFEEILQDYMYTRKPVIPGSNGSELADFRDSLTMYTGYSDSSEIREISSLSYGEPHKSCSIVSSIEFDKDGEFFAVAGAIKKIKVFNYRKVLQNIGFQNPTLEISCNAKLTSMCFNPYHKVKLASSDYDGCVNVWDSSTGHKLATHNEHSKRVWSVMFNPTEPTLFASGSDDCTVKVWTTSRVQSVYTLQATANVCAVRFHPTFRYFMAYGAADHAIHYVDLRQPQQEIHELKGHRKAVSYVQFISDTEIVSASPDSELKMWDVRNGKCLRTYRGHTNENNFVGLSVWDDFIACGSEDNSVYVYNKKVSNPMLSYKFRMPTNQLLVLSTLL